MIPAALVSHPGKKGDLIYALAAVRDWVASGDPVDMVVSPYCRPLLPLLETQTFIRSAWVKEDWNVRFGAPVEPAIPPGIPLKMYPRQLHLGMREWPSPTLFSYYPALLAREYGISVAPPPADPWLYLGNNKEDFVALAWSDENVEIKAAWTLGLAQAFPSTEFKILAHAGSRFEGEFRFPFRNVSRVVCNVLGAADLIAKAKLLVCCNSMFHPLGTALGTPLVCAEPTPPRWQEVFKHRIPRNVYVDSIDNREVCAAVAGALEKVKT